MQCIRDPFCFISGKLSLCHQFFDITGQKAHKSVGCSSLTGKVMRNNTGLTLHQKPIVTVLTEQ